MAVFVYREPQFQKLLDSLRKTGRRSAQAAKQAEEIMDRVAARNRFLPNHEHKLTKYGEGRIGGCRKFDLGGGYRLVYLKKGGHIFFLHVGTHDDCDLWIKNHRGVETEIDVRSCQVVFREKGKGGRRTEEQEPEPDYDELLMEKIDERLLRKVFHGLCGPPK
ncbi:MAG: type II toxin-antitoxin system RelE/ParE family toxin [Deltaproteobacteria bacterium]|nr:type II toxin-antitoxin system RelE/ParE family toxin [Deltaproteobacteria bacterium]MBW2346779.1 type II toxin-antitoxin system RelE/ParE family toxin [Deltaproteobacteria bacterium]